MEQTSNFRAHLASSRQKLESRLQTLKLLPWQCFIDVGYDRWYSIMVRIFMNSFLAVPRSITMEGRVVTFKFKIRREIISASSLHLAFNISEGSC